MFIILLRVGEEISFEGKPHKLRVDHVGNEEAVISILGGIVNERVTIPLGNFFESESELEPVLKIKILKVKKTRVLIGIDSPMKIKFQRKNHGKEQAEQAEQADTSPSTSSSSKVNT